MSLTVLAMSFFVVGLLAQSVSSWSAIRRAKHLHPGLWLHSGRPTLWGNRDLVRTWPLVRYYLARGYLRPSQIDGETLPPICDPEALNFAEHLRLPLVIGQALGVAGIVLAIGTLLLRSLHGPA
jgi:hypothetical protein